jgi:hypothetical protein
MARDLNFEAAPLAEEFDVGDDSDLPGFAQPYTQDDIDALVNSPGASVDERRALLTRMLDDLRSREEMDRADEYDGLIGQLQAALATLDLPADGLGGPGAFAFDEADRPLQPDAILERAEEEGAETAEET